MKPVKRVPVLELAFLAMEALTLFLIDAVVAGDANHLPIPYPAFLAAALGGFTLVRVLARFDLSRGARVVTASALTVAALTAIAALAFEPRGLPPAGFGRAAAPDFARLVGIALLVFQWGRSAQVAQLRLSRPRALTSFSVGMTVLVIALLAGQDTPARDALNAAAIPLVACGLLTLALIHLRDAREHGGEALRGPWMSITIGSVVGLIVAGAVLGVLPLGPLGWVYDHSIAPVLLVVFTALIWISLIVAFPFAWVMAQIIAQFTGRPPPQPPAPGPKQSDQLNKLLKGENGHVLAPIVLLLLKLLLVVGLVLVAAGIAYWLFAKLGGPPEDEGEERESIAAEGSLAADLKALLASLRPRRSPRVEPPEPDLPSGALAVRRLYLRLLDRATERGVDRPPAATPNEFGPTLDGAFTSPAPSEISAAFAAARYGHAEPPAAELRRLEAELEALKHNPVR